MPKHDVETAEPRVWEDKATAYQLRKVRVVATLAEDGGAIVENLESLDIVEGRFETYGTDGRGKHVASLAYGFEFGPSSIVEGDRHVAYQGRIIIRGTAANGRLMEIRGEGWIGHDELGQLSGRFEDLPSIYTPDDEELADHVAVMNEDDAPPTTGEFVWATYGRAQDWS